MAGQAVEDLAGACDTFGEVGTILREFEWNVPTFSSRVVPKTPNANDEGVRLLQAAILYIENLPQVDYPVCVSFKGVAMVSHGKSAMVSATEKVPHAGT